MSNALRIVYNNKANNVNKAKGIIELAWTNSNFTKSTQYERNGYCNHGSVVAHGETLGIT